MKKLALIAGLATIAAPSLASAERSAVLLDFKGWRAKYARVSVLSGVASHVEVAPRSLLTQTASDLGHDVSTDEGVVAAAESIGVSVIIKGRVKGKGKRAKTIIQILDSNLRELESGTAGSPATKRGKKQIRAIASKLMRLALAKLPDAVEDEPVSDAPSGGRRVVVAATSDVDDELGIDSAIDEPSGVDVVAPVVEAVEDVEDFEDVEEPEVVAEVEEKADTSAKASTSLSRKQKTRPLLITAMSGFTFRSRSARIGQTNERNAQHKTGVFPELAISLKLTPFKPGSTLGSAFISLDGRYGFVVASLEGTNEVSTSAYRFDAGIGYTTKVAFLEVGGTLGAGHDAITLGDNSVMGAARYTYVRLGGLAKWEIADSFELHGHVGLRPILSAGEIGSRYGQGAGAFGFDIGGGFTARTDIGFSYGLGLGLNAYALLFSAPGDLSPPVTATGGLDTSIVVDTFIGWAF